MGITGRYDFPGIQKAVRKTFEVLIAGTSWGAWIIASPFKPALDAIENLLINYLVNRGLIIINVGAVMVDGKINQSRLDNALDAAFEKMKIGRDKITPEQGAQIDADTDAAFDDFADVHATDASDGSVPNLSSPSI